MPIKSNWAKWFVDEFVIPLLGEPETLRTLARLREWTQPGDEITPKPFEQWLQILLAVRVEEAGFRILINALEDIAPCGKDEHTGMWSPDIWIKRHERIGNPINIFLKTQLVAPQECKKDIARMEHLAEVHGSPGAFVCVALKPRIEHPKRWQKFSDEVARKAQDWGCAIVQLPYPWMRVLWRGKDSP